MSGSKKAKRSKAEKKKRAPVEAAEAPAQGVEPRRFEYDIEGYRAAARLRLVGALVVIPAGVWLVLSEPRELGWFFALLSFAIGLGWILGFARSLGRKADEWFVAIEEDALHLGYGKESERTPWSKIKSVEIDEGHLVVKVTLVPEDDQYEELFAIPSEWKNTSLQELGEAIEEAWLAATAKR